MLDKIENVEQNLTYLLTKAKEKGKDAVDTVKNEGHEALKALGLEQDDYDGVAKDGHKVLLLKLGETHKFNHGPENVRKAWFGAADHDYEFTDQHGEEVTDKLKALIEGGDGTVVASVENFGDTAKGWDNKVLAVEILGVRVVLAKENEVVEIPEGRILRAWFGASGHNWEWGTWRGKDATARVRQLADVSRSVLVSVENFGDPSPRWSKELLVEVRTDVRQ